MRTEFPYGLDSNEAAIVYSIMRDRKDVIQKILNFMVEAQKAVGYDGSKPLEHQLYVQSWAFSDAARILMNNLDRIANLYEEEVLNAGKGK